jgi:hypothetical protein
MRKPVKVCIKNSTKGDKKLMAVFTFSDGGTKTTHFGASGYDDYTLLYTRYPEKATKKRNNYRRRHAKDNLHDPTSAGTLSMEILWGDSHLRRENIAAYKRKWGIV